MTDIERLIYNKLMQFLFLKEKQIKSLKDGLSRLEKQS